MVPPPWPARIVDLVLVNTPVRPEYATRIPGAFTEHFEKLKAMAQQRGVKVVDGAYYLPSGGWFANQDQVNYTGSIVLTGLLIHELGLDVEN